MATERQLRNRMRQLEKALEQQRQEGRRLEEKIRAETAAQIQRAREQSQQVFQRKLNETTELYTQRVREFQESIICQCNEQLDSLREQADAINMQTQKTLREIEQCNLELRQELQKMKDDAERQKTVFRQTALDANAQAEAARNQTAQTPHSFFCPQEFDIIASHLEGINDQIQSGMYQAAVSDANCIALEFQLLRTKVEQAFSEWMQAFEDYRRILNSLIQHIQNFESSSLKTSEGSFQMHPRELNFWSCGTYKALTDKIREAHNLFSQMGPQEVLEYLNNNAGTNRRAIFEMVVQGRRWADQLAAIMNCIISERAMSDQRLTVSQAVLEELESCNYYVRVNRFLPADAGKQAQGWYIARSDEDPMNSFVLRMCLGEDNYINLRIVPRRVHGLSVSNLYYMTVEFGSSTDEETESVVAETNINRIQSVCGEIGLNVQIHYIPSKQNPAETIRKQEKHFSPPPNPGEQMRYLERKYQ